MTRLQKLISEVRSGGAGGGFAEGDYLEGTAEGAYSQRVQGYFAGGSSLMVKSDRGWNMVWTYNLKPVSGGSSAERAAAMKALAALRRKHHEKTARAEAGAEARAKALAETDWDMLMQKALVVAQLFKAVEDRLPGRARAGIKKSLLSIANSIQHKSKPGWDYETAIAEIEAQIRRSTPK